MLPDSEYRTSSAASIAINILHSFPNIRIEIIVGIGSSISNLKYDIHLGDIIVSIPYDGKGGIFQYDFSKTI